MFATLLLMLVTLPQAAPDVVVVCPEAFRPALGSWLEYRTQQGHSLAVLSSAGSPEEIRRQIRDVARRGRLRFVVLVGDAEPGSLRDPVLRARCVPTHYAEAKVNVRFGSEPHIATDNWYADLDDDIDGDRTPELAVGRLTADSPDELRTMVAKIIAYERSTDFGPWRRRMNVVAGIGGFGRLVDKMIESSARQLLTESVPADYRVSMTYASWQNPYCGDPRQFHATTLERLNEGAWFWVYVGHGYHLALDRVRVPGSHCHILDVGDADKFQCRHGAPIAVFLACYTGAFDATADCLAEHMLREPGGPVAVLAGSRVTMPYAMTVLATALMDQCFQQRPATLGEAVLRSKQLSVRQSDDTDRQRATLDAAATLLSGSPEALAAERAEHLLLLNLLGDPLLRLRYPKQIRLDVLGEVPAAGSLHVSGTCPIDGRATIELVLPRDRLGFKPPPRREFPQTSAELAEFQGVYDRANDRRLRSVETVVRTGRFTARLDVPPDARGRCYVRVFVEGAADCASGSAEVKVIGR
ncbi:MAG: hypothetical protein HQ567_29100 [Candidatus Nealsonbacteria bacterium]|nr:hypothetical protein [Candidatus Nealsonbacteria bacterium]